MLCCPFDSLCSCMSQSQMGCVYQSFSPSISHPVESTLPPFTLGAKSSLSWSSSSVPIHTTTYPGMGPSWFTTNEGLLHFLLNCGKSSRFKSDCSCGLGYTPWCGRPTTHWQLGLYVLNFSAWGRELIKNLTHFDLHSLTPKSLKGEIGRGS